VAALAPPDRFQPGDALAVGARRTQIVGREHPDERARLAPGAGQVALVDRRAVEQCARLALALRLGEPGDEPRLLTYGQVDE
jgi:hypothetical protein